MDSSSTSITSSKHSSESIWDMKSMRKNLEEFEYEDIFGREIAKKTLVPVRIENDTDSMSFRTSSTANQLNRSPTVPSFPNASNHRSSSFDMSAIKNEMRKIEKTIPLKDDEKELEATKEENLAYPLFIGPYTICGRTFFRRYRSGQGHAEYISKCSLEQRYRGTFRTMRR
uniref:Uncharacterized protein n=1 Tax=Setaria digitata TaxID=48799 RepID=A0A915PT28_9BILA